MSKIPSFKILARGLPLESLGLGLERARLFNELGDDCGSFKGFVLGSSNISASIIDTIPRGWSVRIPSIGGNKLFIEIKGVTHRRPSSPRP